MNRCAVITTAQTFQYFDSHHTLKTCTLSVGDVIKIKGQNEFGVSARAQTPDGCQNGTIFALDFFDFLADCSTCPCP